MVKLFFLNDYFKLEPEIVDIILKYGEKRFIKELIKEGIVEGMEILDNWDAVQEKAFDYLEEVEGVILLDLKEFFDIDSYIELLQKEKVIELKYFIEDCAKDTVERSYLWVEPSYLEYDAERLKKKVQKVFKEVTYTKIYELLKNLEKYKGGI